METTWINYGLDEFVKLCEPEIVHCLVYFLMVERHDAREAVKVVFECRAREEMLNS